MNKVAVALLFVCGVALHADDKKKNNEEPHRSAPPPAQHQAPAAAPAPAARQEPFGRRTAPPSNNPQPVHNSGGYQPNPNAGSGRHENTPNNPNLNPTPRGGYQPNANSSRERRDGGYQPNPNPNAGWNTGGSRPSNSGSAVRPFNTGRTRDGGEIRPLTGGRTEYRGPNNSRAEFRRDGSVHEVRTHDMVITHGPAGYRRVVTERADHTRIVTYGHQRGYVQRSYVVSGHPYYQRTYYVRGVAYTRVYRPYSYGGVAYYGYVPAFYYRPAFYGWAYSPWSRPVIYSWGWGGSPWYGYYGGYFSPYPAYASANLWLTDYMIAANLQDAYQQQMDANANIGPPPDYRQGALTPDVKQAIADEVQRQLAQERAESQNPEAVASSGVPVFADNSPHVFVVSTGLDVATADGQQCPVTPGDVLAMNGPPPRDSTAATVQVVASKGRDCQQGMNVVVSLEDLQEMQNHMREVIDKGLGELQTRQGQGGLPAVPAQARGTLQSPVAVSAPPPDQSVAAALTQQDQQATQTEQEVVNQAAPDAMPQPGAPDTPDSGSALAPYPPVTATPTQQTPVTITLGQTPDQVIGLLGQPKQVVDLGARKMFVYTDMKIIFIDGKVADVQ